MIWYVPGTLIQYKNDDELGPMVSDDGGKTWLFTFRSLDEFRQMHPTLTNQQEDNKKYKTFVKELIDLHFGVC